MDQLLVLFQRLRCGGGVQGETGREGESWGGVAVRRDEASACGIVTSTLYCRPKLRTFTYCTLNSLRSLIHILLCPLFGEHTSLPRDEFVDQTEQEEEERREAAETLIRRRQRQECLTASRAAGESVMRRLEQRAGKRAGASKRAQEAREEIRRQMERDEEEMEEDEEDDDEKDEDEKTHSLVAVTSSTTSIY